MKLFFLLAALATFPAHARMDQEEPVAKPPVTPESILAGIYQPWTGPLKELEKTLDKEKNYVVWINVPAQHPMDLRTSDQFRRWVVATPYAEMTISHNMVAFRCRDREGKWKVGATGMTGASDKQEIKMLLGGWGLSVFFSTFTDGHLNPVKEVDEYITKNVAKRGTVFAGFEVSGEQCENMQGFLEDFVRHPSKPHTKFGLLPNPENMEGGGCVTFASVLMKKAGILESVTPSFFRHVSAGRYLFGGNLKAVPNVDPSPTPWLGTKKRSISMNLLLNAFWDSAPSSFPGYVSLSVMDPEKMLYSLKQFGAVYVENLPANRQPAEKAYLERSPLGLRTVLSGNRLPENNNRIEFRRYPITDTYDSEMAAMGEESRAWFRAKVQEGYSLRRAEAVGMPVLLMERK